MKYLNKFFLLLAILGISTVACNEEDFLNEQPRGALSGDALMTQAGADALINAAYAGLAQNFDELNAKLTFFHPPSNWSFGDMRSDDAYKGGGGVGDITPYHSLEIGDARTDNFTVHNKWRALYFAIKRANNALAVLNELSVDIYPQKEERIGEMLFLRGHFYFDLMKNFGSFVRIDETMGLEEVNAATNSFDQAQLWGFIQSDFEQAVDLLPENADLPGRANKFTAISYLAKTHLFQGNWSEVVSLTDQVINAGKYGLFPDFRSLWQPEEEHGPEFIFSIEYSTNDGSILGNLNWGNLLNTPRGSAYNGDNFHRPSQNLVNAYKVDPFNGLPDFEGFNEEDLTNDFVDPRLDHTIGRLGIPWKTYQKEPFNESWCRNAGEYGFTGPKKYNIDPNHPSMVVGWPWGGSPLNWPVIKYSDLILWKAEALVELNQDLGTALEIVNSLRQRAKDTPVVMKLDGSGPAANYKISLYKESKWTQEFAREAIRYERRLELALEGHRFYDLVRWGIAPAVINKYYAEETPKRAYLNGANFTANKNEYLPIPQLEIDRSGGALQQNPAFQ